MYTIKQLQQRTGLTQREVRYYYSMGAFTDLQMEQTTDSILFPAEALQRLYKIILLHSLGVSIPNIVTIITVNRTETWKHFLTKQRLSIQSQSRKAGLNEKILLLMTNVIEIEGELNWERALTLFRRCFGGERSFLQKPVSLRHQQMIHHFPQIYRDDQWSILAVALMKNVHMQLNGQYSHERDDIIFNQIVRLYTGLFQGNHELATKMWEEQKLAGQFLPHYDVDDAVFTYIERVAKRHAPHCTSNVFTKRQYA